MLRSEKARGSFIYASDMSEFPSQRPPYDDTTDDEDEAVADSGHNYDLTYRRCEGEREDT